MSFFIDKGAKQKQKSQMPTLTYIILDFATIINKQIYVQKLY